MGDPATSNAGNAAQSDWHSAAAAGEPPEFQTQSSQPPATQQWQHMAGFNLSHESPISQPAATVLSNAEAPDLGGPLPASQPLAAAATAHEADTLARVLDVGQDALVYEIAASFVTPAVEDAELTMMQTAFFRTAGRGRSQFDAFFATVVQPPTNSVYADDIIIRYSTFGTCSTGDFVHQFATACEKALQLQQGSIRLVCVANDSGIRAARRQQASDITNETLAGESGTTTAAPPAAALSTKDGAPQKMATSSEKWKKMFEKIRDEQGEQMMAGSDRCGRILGGVIVQRSRIFLSKHKSCKPFRRGLGSSCLSQASMTTVADDLFGGKQIEGSPAAQPLIPWGECDRINAYIRQSAVSGDLTLAQQLFIFASLPHGVPAIVSLNSRENALHMRRPGQRSRKPPSLQIDHYPFNIQCQYWMYSQGETPEETARLVCVGVRHHFEFRATL